MRRRSPALRTVPSSTTETPSSAPTARTSSGLPLRANTEVRDETRRPEILASASISSSVIPSLRYSLSVSGLAFTNGSTAMDRVIVGPRAVSELSAATSADTNSAVLVKRCSGSFSRARSSARSTATGTSGRMPRMGRGVSITCFAMMVRGAAPLNGGSPVSISYTTHARL